MPGVALPRLIEEKFEDLTRQVRRLRLYRGVGRFVVAAIALAALGLLADRSFGHTSAARWAITLASLSAVVLAFWHFVIRPQRQLLTTSSLAAAIESQFPSLSERLTTLVELSRSDTVPHGSKPLMDLLMRDTAQRTKRLDFERAAPQKSALRAVLIAGLLGGIAISAALFIGGGGSRIKRLLLPWHTPKIDAPFAIKVSSGSVAAKRGEPITLTAFLERLQPDAVLPANAAAIVRDKVTGIEKNLPMAGDDHAAFHVTRPTVTADFDYRVHAGPLLSDWYTVTLVDPVEIADGTAIAIAPPAYVVPARTKVSLPGFAPFEGLQHSTVEFQLKFNRPTANAALDWQSTDGGAVASERLRLIVAEDRRSATATASLISPGNFRLTMTGEHGATTVLTVPSKVFIDSPPRFEKVVGVSESARQVRAEETIILETAAIDDLRVDALVLEYAVNGGVVKEVPLAVKEPGTARADAKHVWALSPMVKTGDVVKYRLRATDSRRVPDAGLQPQSTYYPEKAWASLAISATAESLDQQDVLSKRDAIQQKLEEAAKLANDARKAAERVHRELGEKPMLTTEQTGRLHEAQAAAAKAAEALDAAAKDASLTPELRGLADALRATAQDGLRAAENLLKRSENEPNLKTRNETIGDAEKKLAAARDRIEQLQKLNETLARNRLDKRRLEKLADDVNKLAADAENATDPKRREELLKKLQRAKDELRDVINGNETLKKGAENSSNQQARDLAAEAARLKEAENKLDADIAKSEADARRGALAGAAQDQDALNKAADDLRNRTATPSRLEGDEPLAKPPFAGAKDKLAEGDNVGAMTEQEKAARELDRLADALEKAAKARSDPRDAARQLSKLQDDLTQRMTDAASKKPLSDAEKQSFAKQQAAIRAAAGKLSTPPGHASGEAAKAEAMSKLGAAEEAMKSGDAAQEQKEAAEALKKLSEKLPPREQRLKAAKDELERLIREQEQLARSAEEKLKPYDRRVPDDALQKDVAAKLADAAKKQMELAEKLYALDAPGLEARRDRAVDSAKKAVADLTDGRLHDVPASQSELRRRMGQLRTALDGGTPGDAVADQLARQQNRLADQLQKGEPDATALAGMQKLQREIADATTGVPSPDSAERLNRAKQSTEAAAKQFKEADNIDELRKKTRQAAKDLDDLADHLSGVEGDRERIERLAKDRRARAEWSKANAGKPTPPEDAAAAQGDLERELGDLKSTRAGAAQEAKKQAQDALERLRRTPNAERAPTLQKAAADALDELAKKMNANAAKAERMPKEGHDAGGQLPSQAEAERARDLALQQRELRDKTAKAAGDAKPDAKTAAKHAEDQKALAEQAGQLGKKLDQASNAPTNTAEEANALTQASDAAKKGQEQMEKAGREQAASRSGSAGEARKEAAKALEQASAKAASAAGDSGPGDPKSAEASKAAEEANGHLRDAGQNAGTKECKECLKAAAGKLGEAADKLGEAGQKPKQPGGDPGGNDGAGGKPLTADDLPPDLKQYAGKPWGELPGDVKTRIIQDLKAKYGEDYARVIKLYFEQLAEKK